MDSYSHYSALAAQHPRLSADEELRLVQVIESGQSGRHREAAIEKLVMHNMDLAVSRASARLHRFPGLLDEGIQVAAVTLYGAARRASNHGGPTFRAFATSRIDGEMIDILRRSPVVRETRYGASKRAKQSTASPMPLESPVTLISMDAPLGDADGSTLHELLPSAPTDARGAAELGMVLDRIDALPARTREIVRMRYGLGGNPKAATLREVALRYAISPERARQIIDGAIALVSADLCGVAAES